MTLERLYLLLHDLRQDFEALKTRHDAMEGFIKDQYPQYFAGDAGTVADPDLSPVNLETNNVERADPATCPHPVNRHYMKSVAWQDKAVKYCDACGAIIQPEKENAHA